MGGAPSAGWGLGTRLSPGAVRCRGSPAVELVESDEVDVASLGGGGAQGVAESDCAETRKPALGGVHTAIGE